MNKNNVKIANEILKIAKELIAVVPHGGHSSKFETDATDPKLIKEMQDLLDAFRTRMIAYNALREEAKQGADDMKELYSDIYKSTKKNRKEFQKKLDSDPSLKALKEAIATLEEVGKLAAKSGASLKAMIAGVEVEVRKSQTPGWKYAYKFEKGVRMARMLEEEMTDFLDICTKRVVTISSKTIKDLYQEYGFYLTKADEYRDKINEAMEKENARRQEQGQPILQWEEIEKWQDGMKQEALHSKKYRSSGIGDWIKGLFNSTQKVFQKIIDKAHEIIKSLTKLISNGEKVEKDIQSLIKNFN